MGSEKTSVWVLADQLSHENNTALRAAPRGSMVVMVESMRLAKVHRPSKVRLALLWSSMRHFAKELRRQRHIVDYHAITPAPSPRDEMSLVDVLREHVEKNGVERLLVMRPAGWSMRDYVSRLERHLGIPVEIRRNEMFLTGRDGEPEKRIPPAEFLSRDLRRRYRVLVDDQGEPEGGQWHFEPRAKVPPESLHIEIPRPEIDDITRDVIALVEARFPDRVGELAHFDWPVNREQAVAHLEDFVTHRLEGWHTWQDTFAHGQSVIAHSRLSAAINIGLLDALEVVARVERAYRGGSIPLDAATGYTKGVFGWREHIHRLHDHLMPAHREANFFEAANTVPDFFWTAETRMACLADVLRRTLATGYANHSERLMLLGNALLLHDVHPHAALEWFASVFADAWEWATLPNVLGMALFADGGATSQRPYAASANYIRKTSDHCRHCTFDPKRKDGQDACPFNSLYWGFIERHRKRLAGIPQMDFTLRGLEKQSPQMRELMRRAASAQIEDCTESWQA